MKMKKQLIAVLLFLCGMTLQAEDEFLYWMIASDATIEGLWGEKTVVSEGSYYAKVGYAATGTTVEQIVKEGALSGYLNLYELPSSPQDQEIVDNATYGGSNISTADAGSVPGVQKAPVYAKGVTAADYTYWVELWNAEDGIVGYASLGTYESLSAFISPMTELASMAASVSVFQVPEPNSALLLMIGCAALALRRRRKIAA